MDRRLLPYYNRELKYLRTVAAEFGREFPKIADRLSLSDPTVEKCSDPYVERLLEGFAFLTARVQLKLDSEFPRFTQNLLETVYPHYLAPTPSMCVVQFNHDTREAGLADGFRITRGTVLRSPAVKDLPSCEYRTCHPVTLLPLEIADARYFTRDVGVLELHRTWGAPDDGGPARRGGPGQTRAALRLRLRTTAGVPFSKIKADELVLHLRGDGTVGRLYEAFFARARGIVFRPVPVGRAQGTWQESVGPDAIERVGYRADESMLPYDDRSFQGYRLLHEYFAFPQRFAFVKLKGLAKALARCDAAQMDVIIPFSDEDAELERSVNAENFALHCTPAVNLFPMRADRIFVSDKASEFQVIPDRTKPLDYEVYRVTELVGYGSRSGEERVFQPFYTATDIESGDQSGVYFATYRVPRAISEREKQRGSRTSYAGTEVYVSLVDAQNAPYSTELKQLSVMTLCTNRDLPKFMPVGKGTTDFTLDIGAPVASTRIVAGPTSPRTSYAEGNASWRLISHLTLNYLSLSDEDLDGDGRISPEEGRGAAALRDLMKLYGDVGDPVIRKQIEGLSRVMTKPILRRVPTPGVIAFGRGLEVSITLDEALFEGTGIAILGSVLDQFFARYVSMNSYTETVVRSADRGEVMRWPAKVGQRPVL
jgi:type VI secretion system protein ImpG